MRRDGGVGMRGWRPFVLITLPVLVLDQLSKFWIRNYLAERSDIVLIPNWLDITYTLNPGAAFSLLANAPAWLRQSFLVALSAIAIVVLVIMLARDPQSRLVSAALALILAGAIGNLIDRVWRGRVTDFILMHYYSHNYPVFNVADSAITIGVMLLLISSFSVGQTAPAAD
jgi:signal peptidase II